MRAWLLRPWRAKSSLIVGYRALNTAAKSHERVEVRCASSGSVTVDLFNVNEPSSTSALFIHFPRFPASDDSPAPLPKFLRDQPVASINYRWGTVNNAAEPTHCPTPIHDSFFAYSWILEHLAPEKNARRDIYVYGSHLGASLAASLALTASHPHLRFAVRGVVAYNGVYNWTMFLPDHPVNRPSKRSRKPTMPPRPVEGSHLHRLGDQVQELFKAPSDMFDPFVSASLYFHNPGLAIPQSFTISAGEAAAIDALTNPDAMPQSPPTTPRKSYLVFPPRTSTLKIPETLLLYDTPVLAPEIAKRRRARGAKAKGNTFEKQALELVELMQRSIDKVELKERSNWDEDIDSWEAEAQRRVQMAEVGEERKTLDLSDEAEEVISEWLDERTPMYK